jgi:hypothetical protein
MLKVVLNIARNIQLNVIAALNYSTQAQGLLLAHQNTYKDRLHENSITFLQNSNQ